MRKHKVGHLRKEIICKLKSLIKRAAIQQKLRGLFRLIITSSLESRNDLLDFFYYHSEFHLRYTPFPKHAVAPLFLNQRYCPNQRVVVSLPKHTEHFRPHQ